MKLPLGELESTVKLASAELRLGGAALDRCIVEAGEELARLSSKLPQGPELARLRMPRRPAECPSLQGTPPDLAVQMLSGFPPHTPEGLLTPGVWKVGFDEFAGRTGFNPQRSAQIIRAEPMIRSLNDDGLKQIYVGGSFLTTKVDPRDIDALVHLPEGNLALKSRMSDLLYWDLDFNDTRSVAQRTYGVDLWQGREAQGRKERYLTYFQQNTKLHRPVGILAVQL